MTHNTKDSKELEKLAVKILYPHSGGKNDAGTTVSMNRVREAAALIDAYAKECGRWERLDEQQRTSLHTYDDGVTVIRFFHHTEQYLPQDMRIAELEAQRQSQRIPHLSTQTISGFN